MVTIAVVAVVVGEGAGWRGLYLGTGRRGPMIGGPEQGALILGPPRSGKTSALVVPNVLAAPGPGIHFAALLIKT